MPTKKSGKLKDIPSFQLDNQYLFVHKEATVDSDFGLDNTNELIEQGFGMYSSAKVKKEIGPLKSQFFRIGFCRQGSVRVDCGLESFIHRRDTIHFNFPGQLFSLSEKSDDMQAYYLLFTQEFIEELLPALRIQQCYPFLDYAGVPFFALSPEEAREVESLIFKIDTEIKNELPDRGRAIKLLIEGILLNAKRSYIRQGLHLLGQDPKASSLVLRYKKLVAQHFIRTRSVKEYAAKLGVSPKHLGKVVKEETGKNAGDFIDEMLLMEIKALLRHTLLNISEIAYQLDFTDPSHLSKFVKKHTGLTPQQYRNPPL